MDPSDYPPGKSPRKELQGPRPTPLKIHKDSHKIRKPPVAPQPSQPQAHQPRQPVIIYTVSPKVIHTNPSDFMNLVQRLTGLSSSTFGAAADSVDATTTSSSTISAANNMTSTSTYSRNSTITSATNPNLYGSHLSGIGGGGEISPAARYATIEKAKSPQGKLKSGNIFNKNNGNDYHIHHPYYGSHSTSSTSHVLESRMEMDHDHNRDDHQYGVESTNKGLFSGILSPGPASLPPIPPNFFSPPSDSFFHDLSPVLHGNRNFNIDQGSFMMPSPASYFISPRMASPNTPSIDFLFNNIFSDNNL
ncbi:VQ motif containing protein [Parasponia andersonii]|uniref:VQ motif containing protein n=1 Tax=Parasponia andersonii TaxID=3476 RepID=A0A2P5DSL4_PARAD|nr:VQ motif containing protein [Parasponia andersonii]